jgi:predicted nucleotidyltransferase
MPRKHTPTISIHQRETWCNLTLFGSLAAGGTSSESDLDLAVRGLPAERYFEALADLMELIGAPIDLVRLEAAVDSLRDRIEAEGERL